VARQGLTHLVNSLAQMIHTRVRADYRGEMDQRFQQRDQVQGQAQEREQIAAMQRDYYGAFPTHNNPAIKQIVALEAGNMATQYPNLPWGPDYIAALGARVGAQLAALGAPAAPQPATPTPAAPVPAARPAAFAPTAPRSAIPNFEQGQADTIADTFNFSS
jgi:hypothetical protein